MSFMLKTLKSVTAYAEYNGIIVQKEGDKYQCWRKDDHSVMAESKTLTDLLNDIDDLSGLWKK